MGFTNPRLLSNLMLNVSFPVVDLFIEVHPVDLAHMMFLK